MPDTEVNLEDLEQVKAAYERQRENAEKANADLAVLAAKDRTREVQDVLRKLNAPETVASVYPADSKVDEDSIRAFLKETVGMEPDKDSDAWRRYDKLRGNTEPPAPPEDELDKWIKTEVAKTDDFYRKQTDPTAEEIKDLGKLKADVTKKLAEWDQEVQAGKMDPIVSPQGFGGFLDPPSYARRARNFVSLQ